MIVRENVVNIGQHQLFYRSAGESGPVIVFLHGIPTNSFLWQNIMVNLSSEYQIIAPDLLGFGQSDSGPIEDLTLPRQAAHIIALLDQLKIREAHFVGHDLGGGIAQTIAVRYPERISSLTVTDGVCFSNWPISKVVAMRWPTGPEFEPLVLAEQMIRLGIFNPEMLTYDLLQAFLSPFAGPKGNQALSTIASALEHHQTEQLVPYLATIKVPTTILWGQFDRILPAYWGLRLHHAIPNSEFRVLPGCGHFTMLDNPGLFVQELQNHFQKATRNVIFSRWIETPKKELIPT